jgi:hypothetical protein
MFTPSFAPRGEHSLLFRRMEGQADNFTPRDNFTLRGQNSPVGENFAPWGQSLCLGAKLRMDLWANCRIFLLAVFRKLINRGLNSLLINQDPKYLGKGRGIVVSSMFWSTSSCPRLGDFSPFGRLFTWRSSVQITEVVHNFGLLFFN